MAKKAGGQGESIGGYFRKLFTENPKLLRTRSNSYVLGRWLEDHPGYREIPLNVKQNMANVKSVMRKKRRRRRALADQKLVAQGMQVKRIPSKGLEALEEQIDDCLTQAKNLDRESLAHVINHLRTARNQVVFIQGQ
jgi:hypothetical protein